MNHPSERLSELINSLSLNINSFSNECGYPSSATIWRIIEQKKKPSNPTINKICNRFPQVNREWLLTGYGEMFTSQKTEYSDELTVTAKQVIDTIVPKMLRHDLVTKAEILIEELHKTVLRFNIVESAIELQNQKLEAIHKKINSMESMQAIEIIKQAKKKDKNGGLDLN
tara:strand:- start:311 stop:820 length:510 start_codon:yes stop_codon:yes gene_type:complete